MATGTSGIEIKNKGLLLLGIILLVIGLAAYLYQDKTSPFRSEWSYPYQTLGLVLTFAGIIFIALGFLYPLQRTPPLPPQKA